MYTGTFGHLVLSLVHPFSLMGGKLGPVWRVVQVDQGKARVRFAALPSSSQTKDRKSQLTLGGGTFKGDRMESMLNQMAMKRETLGGFVTKLAKPTSAKLNGLNHSQFEQD